MAITPEELASLKAQRASLSAAIASGATEMRDQFGRFIGYRRLDEMRSILAGIERQIEIAEGNPPTVRRSRYRYIAQLSKGY